MRATLAAILVLATTSLYAQDHKVFIDAAETVDAGNAKDKAKQVDFGSAIAAALTKKKVPVLVVTGTIGDAVDAIVGFAAIQMAGECQQPVAAESAGAAAAEAGATSGATRTCPGPGPRSWTRSTGSRPGRHRRSSFPRSPGSPSRSRSARTPPW